MARACVHVYMCVHVGAEVKDESQVRVTGAGHYRCIGNTSRKNIATQHTTSQNTSTLLLEASVPALCCKSPHIIRIHEPAASCATTYIGYVVFIGNHARVSFLNQSSLLPAHGRHVCRASEPITLLALHEEPQRTGDRHCRTCCTSLSTSYSTSLHISLHMPPYHHIHS